MAVTLRLARTADAAFVHRVLLAAFESLRKRYTTGAFDATVLDVPRITARLDEGPIWLAEDHGLAVGTVAAVTDRQGCYLRGMAVAPGARGRGVGRALVDAVLEYARSSRADRCWLYTTEFLDDAIRLYERFGFTPFTEDPPPNLHGTPLMGMERPT